MGEEEATNVTAGIWGFLILFGLALACWLLYRSMNGHLRNVRLSSWGKEQGQGTPEALPEPDGAAGGAAGEGPEGERVERDLQP